MRLCLAWLLTTTGLVCALGTMAGCAERKKVAECNALISVINNAVDKIQRGTREVPPDGGLAGKDLHTMAESMDQIADQAAKVQISVPELQQFAKDYQSMAREVAAAARDLGNAYDKVDDEQMRKAQARMERAVQREEPLIDSLNKFCRAP
jgi:hypothetical protein